MTRVECPSCETMFESRFGDDDVECPACRSDDRDRRDPPELGCPVCGEEPPSDRELRSMSGQSFEGRICITDAGTVLVHPEVDQ